MNLDEEVNLEHPSGIKLDLLSIKPYFSCTLCSYVHEQKYQNLQTTYSNNSQKLVIAINNPFQQC